MEDMDHSEAVRLQAAEKYLLGELTPELRDAYEEHYFACSECALDVKAAALLLEGTRQIAVSERPLASFKQRAGAAWFDRGFRWLKPAVAVPVFAVLLAAILYQNLLILPRMKSVRRTAAASEVYGPSFSLIGANVRGGSGVAIAVNPQQAFLLGFDFTPSASFDAYTAQLQDASGRVLSQSAISSSQANQSLHFAVAGGTLKEPGRYSLVLYGVSANGSGSSPTEVQRLSFKVAFQG